MMKIFVAKRRDIIKTIVFILLLAITVFAVIDLKPKMIPVFGTKKELPIYYVGREDRKVSITINCAWGDSDMDSIFATLDKNNVKATFFIVGDFAEKYPNRIKQMVEKGHDVGSHSFRHGRMGSMSKEKIIDDFDQNEKLLEGLIGKKPDLFRAPYGEYNNLVLEIAKEKKYHAIQWDVDSLDWKPDISMEDIKSKIDKNIKAGSIILFHSDTKYTATVLDSIIVKIKEKGYDPVTVSELIYKENYVIEADGKQMKQ